MKLCTLCVAVSIAHNPSSQAGHNVLKTADNVKEFNIGLEKRRKSHSAVLSTKNTANEVR